MKKRICLFCLCLLISVCFAQSRRQKLPPLDGAKIIDNNSFHKKAKHKIVLVNYSSLDVINIVFFVLEEDEATWNFVGNLNKCDFAKEIRLNPTVQLRKADYVAYKADLPKDISIFATVRNNDMYFFVLEKSNKILGRTISFDAIKDSVEDGLYKLDATVQARKYEDNIRVKNAPNCIIMAVSPELGTWEVVGYVERGKFKKLFKGDIDELSTHWVIQVLEAQRDYTISAYAKHDDLFINFVSNASYEEYESESYEDEGYETKSNYDEDYELDNSNEEESDDEFEVFNPETYSDKSNIVSIDGKKYYKLVTNQWNARIELNKKFDLSSYSTLNVEFMMENSASNQVVVIFSDGNQTVAKISDTPPSNTNVEYNTAFGKDNYSEDTNYDGIGDIPCTSNELYEILVFVQEKINWTAIDDVEIYIGKITATY